VKKEILVFITPHILTNDNRQTVSRQDYKAAIDRVSRGDDYVEKKIEASGGVDILSPYKEKKSESDEKRGKAVIGYGRILRYGRDRREYSGVIKRLPADSLPPQVVFYSTLRSGILHRDDRQFFPAEVLPVVYIDVGRGETPVNPLARELPYVTQGQAPTLAEQLKTLTEKILIIPPHQTG